MSKIKIQSMSVKSDVLINLNRIKKEYQEDEEEFISNSSIIKKLLKETDRWEKPKNYPKKKKESKKWTIGTNMSIIELTKKKVDDELKALLHTDIDEETLEELINLTKELAISRSNTYYIQKKYAAINSINH